MIYFTSDTHFGDDRLNLYGRDIIFNSVEECDTHIIKQWNLTVNPDDIVYLLGDVAMNMASYKKVKSLNGHKILIKGNYDEKYTDNFLLLFFNEVKSSDVFTYEKQIFYLNHYPTNGDDTMFNLVGHIHGLWRVQRNMINVGCDAWHFTPISINQILFVKTAIEKYYDGNVFAGELKCNTKHIK